MAEQYQREEINPFMDLEAKWAGEDLLAPLTAKYDPQPVQDAAPAAGPAPVQEADSLLDQAYRKLGYKAGVGKYADLQPGDSTAHPILQRLGLYDRKRHNKLVELSEAQKHIQQMVLKSSQKHIDNMINPKDISEASPGIQPTAKQMEGVAASPTFDVPNANATSQFDAVYPENQNYRYAAPHGPMTDLQEALMASVIAGHLTQGKSGLEPTSVVAAQGRQVTPGQLGYALSQADHTPDEGSDNPDGSTSMSPMPVVPAVDLPASLASTVVTQRGKQAGEQQHVQILEGQDQEGNPVFYKVDKTTGKATQVQGASPKPVEGSIGQVKAAQQALSKLEASGRGKSQQATDLRNLITKITTHQPATTVNVDREKNAFEQEVGKEQAKALMDSYKAAQDSLQVLDTTQQGRKILNSGMITGFGAESVVKIGQALRQVGFNVGGSDIENSQAYAALMAQNVGKIIKQFGAGTGLSDADREYAEKMAGGKITLDKKAIEKILSLNERAARNIIRKHNKLASGIKNTIIPLTVDEPAEQKAGNLKDKSTDELFKMLQEK